MSPMGTHVKGFVLPFVSPSGTLLPMARDETALHVRVSPEQLERLKRAAAADGAKKGKIGKLSEWARESLEAAAKKALGEK